MKLDREREWERERGRFSEFFISHMNQAWPLWISNEPGPNMPIRNPSEIPMGLEITWSRASVNLKFETGFDAFIVPSTFEVRTSRVALGSGGQKHLEQVLEAAPAMRTFLWTGIRPPSVSDCHCQSLFAPSPSLIVRCPNNSVLFLSGQFVDSFRFS